MIVDSNCGIYAIHGPSGIYVGSTTSLHLRWRQHRKLLRYKKHHCRALQFAWLRHGEGAFHYEVIEKLPFDNDLLLIREQHYLDAYEATLYNSQRIATRTTSLSDLEAEPPNPLNPWAVKRQLMADGLLADPSLRAQGKLNKTVEKAFNKQRRLTLAKRSRYLDVKLFIKKSTISS